MDKAHKVHGVVAYWLSQRTTVDRRLEVPFRELRADYESWCAREGAFVCGAKIFSRALEDAGFQRWRGKKGRTSFIGIKLNALPAVPAPDDGTI